LIKWILAVCQSPVYGQVTLVLATGDLIMSVSKIIGAVGLVAALGFSSLSAVAADDRASVAAKVKAACSGGATPSCIALINAQLALAARLGNNAAGLAVAAGLADAIGALGGANPGLGAQLASIVASNGASFVQVAFGAVLDGTGTGSIGGGGGSVGQGSSSGSAG
jgi:hypothetical protein